MNQKDLGSILSPEISCEYCGKKYTYSAKALSNGIVYQNTHNCPQKRQGTTLAEIADIAQRLLQLNNTITIQTVEPIDLADLTPEDWEQIRSTSSIVGNGSIYGCWLISWSPKNRRVNNPPNQATVVKTRPLNSDKYTYVITSARARVL